MSYEPLTFMQGGNSGTPILQIFFGVSLKYGGVSLEYRGVLLEYRGVLLEYRGVSLEYCGVWPEYTGVWPEYFGVLEYWSIAVSPLHLWQKPFQHVQIQSKGTNLSIWTW